MFARKGSTPATRSAKSSQSGLSFIGPEVVISGDLATTAQLHVDGRIDGHVRCGQLCQGATGTIAGDIVAEEARIAGLVEGTVHAKTLIVEASGRIAGDVTYQTISIAAGARIDGRLARREALGLDGGEGTGGEGTGGEADLLIVTPKASRPRKAASGSDLFPREEDTSTLIVD